MIFDCWRKTGWKKEERHEIEADTFDGTDFQVTFFRSNKRVAVLWGMWNVKPKEGAQQHARE